MKISISAAFIGAVLAGLACGNARAAVFDPGQDLSFGIRSDALPRTDKDYGHLFEAAPSAQGGVGQNSNDPDAKVTHVGGARFPSSGATATNSSPVPLPYSLPMFAAGILALALFGYCVSRWVAPEAKADAGS